MKTITVFQRTDISKNTIGYYVVIEIIHMFDVKLNVFFMCKKIDSLLSPPVKSMCDAAYKGSDSAFTDLINTQCLKSLCLPICLEKMITCDFKVSCTGWDQCTLFQHQFGDITQSALCSQLKAHVSNKKQNILS